MAAATIHREPALVGHRADGWLTGWFAVLLWAIAWIGQRSGYPFASLGLPWFWPATVLSAMHFGMTYHLAYGQGGPAIRRRPVALVLAPLVLGLALLAIVVVAVSAGSGSVRGTTATALSLVYLLTTWHYIKQVYGVVRIGARYRGVSFTVAEAAALRYGLYPLWFLGASAVLTKGRFARYAGLDVTHPILSPAVIPAARLVAVVGAAAVVWALASACTRQRVLPSAVMIAPNLAALLWIAVPVDYVTTTLALGALHGLQYLACCHRAHLSLPAPEASRRASLRWVEIFGGAACGGLLLTTWLPQLLNRTFEVDGAPLLFTAVFFVFLNLHHYLIDAVIWRSTGDIVRSLGNPVRNQKLSAPYAATIR